MRTTSNTVFYSSLDYRRRVFVMNQEIMKVTARRSDQRGQMELYGARVNSKPVICVETGVEYESINAAAEAHGLPSSTLRDALRRGKKAGDHLWCYASDGL
eukprot:g21608.t1